MNDWIVFLLFKTAQHRFHQLRKYPIFPILYWTTSDMIIEHLFKVACWRFDIFNGVRCICWKLIKCSNYILTLSWQAYKNDDFGRQGPFNGPSLKSVKMKLQRCARSQNRGSWVCPTILDYSQMATMCISCVYTCPSWYQENWSQEIFTKILIVEGPAVV